MLADCQLKEFQHETRQNILVELEEAPGTGLMVGLGLTGVDGVISSYFHPPGLMYDVGGSGPLQSRNEDKLQQTLHQQSSTKVNLLPRNLLIVLWIYIAGVTHFFTYFDENNSNMRHATIVTSVERSKNNKEGVTSS